MCSVNSIDVIVGVVVTGKIIRVNFQQRQAGILGVYRDWRCVKRSVDIIDFIIDDVSTSKFRRGNVQPMHEGSIKDILRYIKDG